MTSRLLIEHAMDQLLEALAELRDGNGVEPDSLVALQLPAGLIREYEKFAGLIRDMLECQVMVLLRPTYGACDIPFPDLEESGVRRLIHLGHSSIPMVRDSIPVTYVPVGISLDGERLRERLSRLADRYSLEGKRVALATTVQYAREIESIAEGLRELGAEVSVSSGGPRASLPGQVLGCNFEAARDEESDIMIYVGTGRFHPQGIAIYTGKEVLALDPHSGEFDLVTGARFLKKRAALALSLSDAEKFLVLFCPRAGQRRLTLARRLTEEGRKRGYSCELAMLDEVRPEYFLGLSADAVVSTACPRIAYDDTSAYPAPVITPGEFRLAIGEIGLDELGTDEL